MTIIDVKEITTMVEKVIEDLSEVENDHKRTVIELESLRAKYDRAHRLLNWILEELSCSVKFYDPLQPYDAEEISNRINQFMNESDSSRST